MTIHAPEKLLSFLQKNEAQLKDLFIVSEVELSSSIPAGSYQSSELEGLGVLIRRARGKKCERCWVYDVQVGHLSDHPTVCPRCHDALLTGGGQGKL